jgi:CO dehydrogenase/acetyl-CoA synthase epsilon subunit
MVNFCSEANRDAAQKEAAEQIERYRSNRRFAGRSDVKYASIVFIGKKKYVIQLLF